MAREPIKKKLIVLGDMPVMHPLADVKPNPWNPNKMTARDHDSLAAGFKADGWLASQALTIWRSDENGVKQVPMLVIDGEQRYTVGVKVGFVEAPMVFLDNLSRAKAKALTVKLQKRGSFDQKLLKQLVQSIQYDLTDSPDAALELGFNAEEYMGFLAEDANRMEGGDDANIPEGKRGVEKKSLEKTKAVKGKVAEAQEVQGQVRMVQLFFNVDTKTAYDKLEARFLTHYKVKSKAEAVLFALRDYSATLDKQ